MKNTIKVLGFAAIIAAIAFNALLLTGCPPEPEDPTVESIAITKNPDKMEYAVGEKFDPTGMIVTATYSDGTKKEVTGYTVSGAFSDDGAFKTLGPNGVTISFGGKNAFVNNINVTKPINSIAVTTPPTKTTYTIGEDLVIAGLVVTATFSDNTTGPVAVTAADISGYDKTKTGSQTLTVTFGGKTATFTVTVNPAASGKTVTGITVTPPTKIQYNINEDLDIAGMVVTATYSDATTEAVTGSTTSGYDKTKVGSQNITVTNNGKTAVFTVIVINPGVLYIITGSGTSFTAAKGTATIGTAGPIPDVINAIRTDANGAACVIQFGDGTTVLNTGTASVSFNNTGGTWGTVALIGKISAMTSSSLNGSTVIIDNDVSVTSNADIAHANTSTGVANVNAIRNVSTGTLTIIGGTLSATGNNRAIYHNSTGTVNIQGGTLRADAGGAIVHNNSTGTINISGGTIQAVSTLAGATAVQNEVGTVNISGGTIQATGSNGRGAVFSTKVGGKVTVSGTAKITSATESASYGTIIIANTSSESDTTVRLEISGGLVENTGNGGRAIYNFAPGEIIISGGTVQATGTDGYAVFNNSPYTPEFSKITITSPPAVIIGKQQLARPQPQ